MEEPQFNTMETPQSNHFGNGIVGTLLSGFFSVLAWIKLQDLQTVAAIAASTAAFVSACLGGYSWWLTIQEKRLNIQKNKNQ